MDKNIQEALKWIYASLGGDISALANVNDVTAILNAIADLDTVQKIKSATELPDVSDADDGDVLTVVDGEWAKAEPSGGGSSLPSVTPTDNGDVLTVVDGAWDKAAPSGLPAVTGADFGKTMQVGTGTQTLATVVPEQTVTPQGADWEYTAVLSNVNAALFTPFTPAVVTMNGVSYNTYINAGGFISFNDEDENGYVVYPSGDDFVFQTEIEGTFTVSVSVKQFAGAWSPAPQVDMLIRTDLDTVASIAVGSYDAVLNKIACGLPPIITVMAYDNVSYMPFVYTPTEICVTGGNIDINVNAPNGGAWAYAAGSSGGSPTYKFFAQKFVVHEFVVAPDGTVTYSKTEYMGGN